jgi:hypothetical protein
MTGQESDNQDTSGFINGRPVEVGVDGKVTYLDKQEQLKVRNPQEPPKSSRIVNILRIGIGLIVLFFACRYLVIPFFETGGGNADTREVPGDAVHFDPIANFTAIKGYAGDGALLTSFDAYYVRSDGTLDLTAEYRPYLSLEFVIPTTAPANAPPVGAGGSTNGKWYIPVDIDIYEPGQWRHVTSSNVEYDYMNKGMERDTSTPTSSDQTILSDPACSFADLWQTAIQHDAPQSAVAVIRYDESGYDFNISDVSIYLQFDTNCHLERDDSGETVPEVIAPEVPVAPPSP